MKRILVGFFLFFLATFTTPAYASKPIDNFQAHPPIHIKQNRQTPATGPVGLTPSQVRAAYNLTGSGNGTIAIIDAYDYPSVQNDINKFSAAFGLPTTTVEVHKMFPRIRSDKGWAMEAALDTQWAHAIAPNAHILLVEAKSASGTDLLNAVNYARSRPDVVAISMSWGGNEFSGEQTYDNYFTGNGITFFASSGDSGTGVSWPAVSPNVVGVGGTNLTMSGNTVVDETAWSGSGGGVSFYVNEPSYQSTLVTTSGGKRAVPDVSYAAGPNPGFPVYDTTGYSGWITVYGTSAGAPQWAAIKSLGSVSSSGLYTSTVFRDITSGSNGTCGYYCDAQIGYDYVTGLGSPLNFSY